MPYEAPPELSRMSLADVAQSLEERRLPPVAQWHPAEEADSRMRIAADGTWYHDGGVISRKAMVRAFSTLLLRDEDGQHWLMTPQYRQSIAVEDAPFIAVDVARKDDALVFRLNTEEDVICDADHPLRIGGTRELPAIYLSVRNNCEARINRSTWLQLVELADTDGDVPHVASCGTNYALVPQ